ncbi:hypothetical protein ZIOFF_043390 [Zingiber officinale]|uniref:Uncharacterized protein n=1 Tax=Zingiber officinale TaxID=94328 RepID=A0A8J5KTY9_ZINOF|nr:hypothetical protein ZIOFF_043390 [Zingiber officinale]
MNLCSRWCRYVEVDQDHDGEFFYYFIESENNPAEDPLLLWLTGGGRSHIQPYPGCSPGSIWPLKFVTAEYNGSLPSLVYHPYSWTKVANIIFWLVEHPQFISNPLYILGDSYAGKIVPMVAKRILDGIDEGKEPLLNLQVNCLN